MKSPSDNWDDLRLEILGLGDHSVHKTHYPSLRSRLTELQRLRSDLQRSEAYLSEAQRLSHTGSFGWRPPKEEIYCSDETLRIFEYDPSRKLTLDLVFERFHPDDVARVKQILERASKDGTDFDYEHRLLMPDGRVKWLHVRAHTLKDSSGGIEFIGAVTDFSERRNIEEEAAHRIEKELRDVINAIPANVWSALPDGSVDFINQRWREFTGLSAEAALGWKWKSVVYSDDRNRFVGQWRAAIESGQAMESEVRVRRADGEHRWWLVRMVPRRDDHGNIVKWYGKGIDIEDRRRAEEARMQERVSERMRIARELHDTLLQSFHGLLLFFQAGRDLVRTHPDKAEEILDSTLDRAQHAITEARDAIQNMRSSTTVTNDLAAAVQAVENEFASEHGPRFKLIVEGSPIDLHPILRHDIYRITREAICNAFQHAHAQLIEVEISYGNDLRLRVHDDGKGMDPQTVKEGRSGHYGIPGMRERAAGIGAELEVCSNPGTGTQIELRIPGSIAYGTSAREAQQARH